MKRVLLTMVILMVVALFTQGCIGLTTVRGSGDMASEDREVSNFKALDFATIGNVQIKKGDEESLRIEAEDNLIRFLETEVRDETLHIDSGNSTIIPSQGIFFFLTVKDLESISVSGLGNVDATELEAGHFTVDISGGGNVDIEELEAERLEVGISGVGELSIGGGEVGIQSVDISGGGNHQSRDMAGDEVDVTISGLGTAAVWARDHLNVEISGGGSVSYRGNPTVEQDISGLGRVEAIGE